ncbi:MAG: dihydrofolate reductase family protein, partial [Pseudonocardiaceae bacterium]
AAVEWYGNGDVATTMGDPDRVFHVSAASAEYIRSDLGNVRAVVIGRHLFDITNGWNGVPAAGDHIFVVTHQPPTGWEFPDAPFTFVTDGVTSAIEHARAVAGDGDVSVTAGDIGGQALEAGLVDEVHLSLVPVLFGSGKRFFGSFTGAPQMLENPQIIEGDRVLHLAYAIRRP